MLCEVERIPLTMTVGVWRTTAMELEETVDCGLIAAEVFRRVRQYLGDDSKPLTLEWEMDKAAPIWMVARRVQRERNL